MKRGGSAVPGAVFGVVGTFALSLIAAYTFLRRRCRGIGPPFGRRSWPWATVIVVGTAAVSAALGGLIMAAVGHSGAAYAGILVPAGLQLSKLPPQRDRDMRPRTWSAVLTLPFSRLYDRMGEDMQAWCDTRLEAARPRPQWIADAAQYYWNQMGRGTNPHAVADLERWRDSITRKISMVRHTRAYHDDYDRLETEALNELNLFLAHAYRLGYHKMLVYPFRPGAHRPQVQAAEPVTPDR
jgi:hypothetical protein